MFSARRRNGIAGRAPVALLAVLLLPALARAQGGIILLRNDTQMTVLVNVSSVVGRRVVRARPQLVNPKLAVPFALPGTRVINLYDARFPTRPLYQGTIPASPLNMTLSIQADTPPRLKLVPVP